MHSFEQQSESPDLDCKKHKDESAGSGEATFNTQIAEGSAFRALFDLLPEPVLICDPAGRVRWCNPPASGTLGFDPVGMAPRELMARIQPVSAERKPAWRLRPLVQAFKGRRLIRHPYVVTDRNGAERLFEVSAVPLYGAGRIAAIVLLGRDPSIHSELHSGSGVLESALSAAIEKSNEGVLIADAQGKIILSNPAAQKMFDSSGVSPDRCAGPGQMAFHHPDGRPLASDQTPLRRSLLRGESIDREDFLLIRADGLKQYLKVTAAPVLNRDGEIKGAVGVFGNVTEVREEQFRQDQMRRDLELRVAERTGDLRATIRALESQMLERRQMENELRRSQLELRNLSRRTLSTLEDDRKWIAKELHDSIGVSLAAIKLSLEEKIRLEAATGRHQVQRPVSPALNKILDALTDTIKETKRVAARLRPLTLDDLGLLSTIQAYCREFGEIYKAIEIEITIRVKESEMHPDQKIVIYRVLQEAMQNAARHGEPHSIRIRLERNGDAIEFRLEDDGRGFDPSSSRIAEDPVSGRGLKNMRERVTISGGAFGLESRIGGGTRLRIVLPLQPSEAALYAESGPD